MEIGFCNSTFWDPQLSWYTEDPDFLLCFEETVLTWTPCLLLWILTPLQLYFIFTSKNRNIPWHFLNFSKLVLNLVLIGVYTVSLFWSVVQYFAGEKIFPVDIWTPLILISTFILAAIIVILNKIRGLHTCAILFFFWLSLSIGGAAQFRSEIRQIVRGMYPEPYHKFVIYMLYYPIVLITLLLNLFADPAATNTYYPKTKKTCPEVRASFTSKVVFGWLDELIWKGFRHPLTVADLWDLRLQDTSPQIVRRFEKSWKKCFKSIPVYSYNYRTTGPKENPSLHSTIKAEKPINIVYPIIRTFWVQICSGGLTKVIYDLLSFVNPQILNLMIAFVAGKEEMWKGLLYAVGMFVTSELQTLFFHHNLMTMYIVGLNSRTALMSAIYKKALRISNSARKTSTIGEVVNLMAVDAQRFADFAPFLHFVWSSPVSITLAIYFLWQIMGPSSLAGLCTLIIILPIDATIANKVKTMQMEQMKLKDERLKIVNEVLNGIKALKMYAWEPIFKDNISKIREEEISLLRKSALWNASSFFVSQCSSFLVCLVTFAVFVLSDTRNVLTPELAFVSIALFNVIRIPIFFFPLMTQNLVQAVVSAQRINKFMNADELDLKSVSNDENSEESLIMERGTFSWQNDEMDKAALRNVNLRVKTGSLVAVVGAVGSGKSSLISAFLGEMNKMSGYVNIMGRVAYVPQQAWIQNVSIKDNIVFGNTFDFKRYNKTVQACALKDDFKMLQHGDETQIGEKGINLSGGQKQRVSLARAVYHDADIYLLDDPLSAVDSHVGKHIFENVIGPKGQLRKKTRVLVTHGVWLLPWVDNIVVMTNGEITEEGTYKELIARKGDFSEFLSHHMNETKEEQQEPIIDTIQNERQIWMQKSRSSSYLSLSSASSRKALTIDEEFEESTDIDLDKIIQEEQSETGSVKFSVYLHYIQSAGIILSISTLGFQLLAQLLTLGGNISLSHWTSDQYTVVKGEQDLGKRNFYFQLYAAFGIGQMASVIMSSFALALATTVACRYLHLSMLSSILRAPMSFFDTTPSGRIVNRFGKDVDVVDNTVPYTVSNALSCFGNVLGTTIVVTWSTPAFAIAILPLGLVYFFIQKIYVTTSRQLKRIESVSRSPIYSHFGETISGASSIRAYKAEHRFIKTLESRVDANQVCLYPSLVSNRWLGIRLETVGNILLFSASVFAVLGRDTLDPGIVGLSVSSALQITAMLSYAVRMLSEVETNIVSVERIKQYCKIEQEAAWEVKPKPDGGWPFHGTVHFDNYQVRYREGLELVLRGVTFVINGGEKIGVVGRTGAGKSSLTLCLFRILEAAGGSIYIDGLDIAKIGLGDVRSKLTIIPQDPFLFSGTLRSNLDPFGDHNDSAIWRVLKLTQLETVTKYQDKGLDFAIVEGGENLSVGQRQLICLARALLRKTKVLILDEATASIDLETEDLVQQTIRREFRDCTVLTIAHRLNTIMDSDRVIVLDKGMIEEFDTPNNLLKSPTSIFYQLAEDSGLTKSLLS